MAAGIEHRRLQAFVAQVGIEQKLPRAAVAVAVVARKEVHHDLDTALDIVGAP